MTETVEVRESPAQISGRAAVSIEPTEIGCHIGVFYVANDAGDVRHLHLAFHHALRDEIPASRERSVVPALAGTDLSTVATFARLVARRNADGRVPYALKDGARLNADGGVDLRGALGLTCATFVMELFRAADVVLLDEATWHAGRSAEREEEDRAAQAKLVGYLRSRNAVHAGLVEGEVGCTRFRSEEVAAASGLSGHPIGYDRAELFGRVLLMRLGE